MAGNTIQSAERPSLDGTVFGLSFLSTGAHQRSWSRSYLPTAHRLIIFRLLITSLERRRRKNPVFRAVSRLTTLRGVVVKHGRCDDREAYRVSRSTWRTLFSIGGREEARLWFVILSALSSSQCGTSTALTPSVASHSSPFRASLGRQLNDPLCASKERLLVRTSAVEILQGRTHGARRAGGIGPSARTPSEDHITVQASERGPGRRRGCRMC